MTVKDYTEKKLKELEKARAKGAIVTGDDGGDGKQPTSGDEEIAKNFFAALASGDRDLLVKSNRDVRAQHVAKNLDLGDEKQKAQTVGTIGSGTSGGILVPTTVSTSIISKLKYISPIRQIATVISNMPARLQLPSENAMAQAYWVGEGGTATESGETFDPNILEAFKMVAFDSFTSEVLEDAATNPSLRDYVEDRFAIAMSLLENAAFVQGDGTNKPYGFRSSAITPASVAQAGAALTYTDAVALKYTLPTAYRQLGVYVTSSAGLMALENVRDANNRPIWRDGLKEGEPGTVLGRPIYVVDEIPANLGAGTNTTELWYGNFKNYIIGDRGALRVDYGTNGVDFANDKISLRMIRRVGGRPVLGESFAKLTGVK